MDEEVMLDLTDMETDDKPVIKVIGVGGGGGNAANYMYEKGIKDVDFVVCNTDRQALKKSPIPYKIQLGDKGLGAGNNPEKGLQEAEKSLEEIKKMLQDSTEMVFVTACMGGGTGTGAAPLIAKVAKEQGILTVGIVTIPFLFEGRDRVIQALQGVEEMKKSVDSLVVISSERIKEIYSDLTLAPSFNKANDILATAAKGIAEVITRPGYINCDLEDVRTVLTQSGTAIMGSAKASGPDRAVTAIQESLNSPLLLTTNLAGSKKILLNISYGKNDILMDEVSIITDHLLQQIDSSTQIIWGAYEDETLADDELSVTIVAAGFPDKQAQEMLDNSTSKRNSGTTRPMPSHRPVTPVEEGFVITPVPRPQSTMAQQTMAQQQPVFSANESANASVDISKYYGEVSMRGRQPQRQPAATQSTFQAPSFGPTELTNIDEDEDSISSFTQSYKMDNEDVSRFSIRNDSDDMFDDKNGYLNNNVD